MQNELKSTSAFDLTRLDNTVTAVQKNSGLKVVFDLLFDTWSLEVPAKYAGKTEGLCGMADGDKSNDFWVGEHPAELDDFFKYWSIDSSCDVITQSQVTSESRATCEGIFAKAAFVEMSSAVDMSEYVETCANFALPPSGAIGSDWPGCSVLAAFAESASRAGKCVEWRSEDLCAYGKCAVAGSSYSSCGPSVVQTCDNYKTYQTINVNYHTEGCFCPSGKVRLFKSRFSRSLYRKV